MSYYTDDTKKLRHTTTKNFYETKSRKFRKIKRSNKTTFTDIKELDWMILLNLGCRDLFIVSLVNTHLNKLVLDDNFWREKTKRSFSIGVLINKPVLSSCHNQYLYLLSVTSVTDEIRKGRLDALIALDHRKYQFSKSNINLANWAAGYGRLDILRWLSNRHHLLPTSSGANGAARHGHVPVLRWVLKHDIFPDQSGVNLAAYDGKLEIIKLLSNYNFPDGRPLLPNSWGANLAARRGHLPVLKFLANYGILPSTFGANLAAKEEHLEVLEWLVTEHNIYPDTWGTMKFKYLQLMRWLKPL